MTVDTKKVAQRREVHYDSYDDLLADAERLVSGDVQTVGNWTLGQIFKHLAQTLNSSIDGTNMKFPWLMKPVYVLDGGSFLPGLDGPPAPSQSSRQNKYDNGRNNQT